MDLKSTMGRITELEELVAQLRAENDLLKSQVYRFEKCKERRQAIAVLHRSQFNHVD